MNLKPFAAWLGIALLLYVVGGPVGVLVAVAIGWYQLLRLDGRYLVGISVVLFIGVPVTMVIQGLMTQDTLEPRLVGSYLTSNNLAFAGVVCLVAGVVLSVRQHDDGSEAEMSDLVNAAVIDEAPIGLSIAAVDDAENYFIVTEQEVEHGGLDAAETSTRRSLFTGAGWMSVIVVTQAATGAGFWFLASHVYPTSTVGLASALFSLLLLVNFVTGMGLQVTVPLYAGTSSREDSTVLTWALLYTTLTSAIGTAVFLLVVSSDATNLLHGEAGWVGWLIFFVSVAGASVASVIDVRLMGARRWSVVFARQAIVGFGRIALLFVPHSGNGALWLFSVGSLPVAISGIVAVFILPSAAKLRYHLWPAPSTLVPAFRFASVNFLATMSSQAPTFILPVIVLANVTPEQNAQYFLAWSAASIVFLFPTTIGQVLLVESSGTRVVDPHQARMRYLEALGLSVGIAVLGTIASLVFESLVLKVFGSGYAGTASLLPWLVAAGIPWAFTAISLTRARLRKDSRAIIATTVTLGVAVIGAAIVLVPRDGTIGAAIAWLGGQTVGAVVAVVCDWLWTRRAHDEGGDAEVGTPITASRGDDERGPDDDQDDHDDLAPGDRTADRGRRRVTATREPVLVGSGAAPEPLAADAADLAFEEGLRQLILEVAADREPDPDDRPRAEGEGTAR